MYNSFVLVFSCFLGTGKSHFMRQCLANFEAVFNFPDCQKIYYVYNSLSQEYMDSFKNLKCPPIVFVRGFDNDIMSLSNLKKITNSVFCFDDSSHLDEKSILRDFHCISNHHQNNTSFTLLHSLYSKELKHCREVCIFLIL